MKRVVFEFDTCEDCPYVAISYEFKKTVKCGKDDMALLYKPYTIPEWCPLEDTEE